MGIFLDIQCVITYHISESNLISRRKMRTGQIPDTLVILGTTASGKTSLGVKLARMLCGEIISADSRQVFRGMDLGTGKDLVEYSHGGESVPTHAIDILDPSSEFDVFKFKDLCLHSIESILKRNRLPMIVGGTGLYLSSVIQDYEMSRVPYDPVLRSSLEGIPDSEIFSLLEREGRALHNTTDSLDRERAIRAIEISRAGDGRARKSDGKPRRSPSGNPRFLILGVRWPRDELRERIRLRLGQRIGLGLIEEVSRLHQNGISWERLDSFGLEYRYVSRHLLGGLSLEEMEETLTVKICQFAKRQEAWFRKMEREGVTIHWVEKADLNMAMKIVSEKSPWSL